MQVELPDLETRIEVIAEKLAVSDDEFFEFCMRNPKLRIERGANGEVTIIAPAGFETGHRNNEVARQLGNWAKRDGRGIALDSSTEYILPNGAALSPDASWILKSRLEQYTKEEKKRFLRLCPDFVVELVSHTDRLPRLQAKLEEWIENGAQLGWLIDADRRTVYVYRPGREPESLADVAQVAGEGPVEGFRLKLRDIWKGP